MAEREVNGGLERSLPGSNGRMEYGVCICIGPSSSGVAVCVLSTVALLRLQSRDDSSSYPVVSYYQCHLLSHASALYSISRPMVCHGLECPKGVIDPWICQSVDIDLYRVQKSAILSLCTEYSSLLQLSSYVGKRFYSILYFYTQSI